MDRNTTIYFGINGVATRLKKIYWPDADGNAKEVKKIYEYDANGTPILRYHIHDIIDGVCSVCSAGAHTHSYSTTVTKATCTRQGYTTYTCGCGYSYKGNYVDALGHLEVIDEAVEATCIATGLTEGKHCSRCNIVLVEQIITDALGHVDSGKDNLCDRCGDAICEHSMLEVLPRVEATCTSSGLTAGEKCKECGMVLVAQQIIPAKGHTEVTDEGYAATCTESGLTEGSHCSVCNEVLEERTVIAALGHSFTNYVSDDNATCTADGTKTAKCGRCDETDTITDVGSMLEHSYATTWSKNTSGHWHKCSTCTTITGYAAHSYGDDDSCDICEYERSHVHRLTLVPSVAATCTTAGNTAYYTCSGCDDWFKDASGSVEITDKSSVIISALDHTSGDIQRENEVAATCIKKGSYDSVVYCTVCNAEISRTKKSIDMVDHVFPEDGVSGYYFPCNVCGQTYCDVNGGHTPGAAATCTTAQLCTTCGTVLVEVPGHTAGAAATCTTAQTCTVCGTVLHSALEHLFVIDIDGYYGNCTRCGANYCDTEKNGSHTNGTAVKENEVAATCTKKGSYDSVVYCTVCGKEVSRTTESVAMTAHAFPIEGSTGYYFPCTVCGMEYCDVNDHAFKADTDGTICSNCGKNYCDAMNNGEHTAGAAATCTTAQTCTECGKELAEATGHTPGAAATCDTAQKCTVCGTVLAAAKGHAFATEAITGYKFDCSTCGIGYCDVNGGHALSAAIVENKVEATCTKKGSYDSVVYCSVCGKEVSRTTKSIAMVDHVFTEVLGPNNTTYYGACTVCKVSYCTANGGHTPDAAATCTTAQLCTKCGTVLAEATGHTAGAAATCTTAQKCTVCGTTLKNATGHAFPADAVTGYYFPCTNCGMSYCDANGGHVAGTAATCTTAQLCTTCGTVLAEAKGHTAGAAATCTTAQTCTVCSAVLAEATGHTAGAAATCTTAQKCTVCKATLVAAKGHAFPADATTDYYFPCTSCGMSYCDAMNNGKHTAGAAATCTTAQLCTACGATITAALGHEAGAAATCTTAQVCTRCYTTLTPATGVHIWSDWVTDTEATCTTKGYKIRECTTCGKEEEETIAATGHTAGADATCTTDQTCTKCGTVLVAGGHKAGTAATCTTSQYCTVCKAVLVEALGHNLDLAGTKCLRCGSTGPFMEGLG